MVAGLALHLRPRSPEGFPRVGNGGFPEGSAGAEVGEGPQLGGIGRTRSELAKIQHDPMDMERHRP